MTTRPLDPHDIPRLRKELTEELRNAEQHLNALLDAVEAATTSLLPDLHYGLRLGRHPDGRPRFEAHGTLGPAASDAGALRSSPALDWALDPIEHVVRVQAEVPGVSKGDVHVEVTPKRVRIHAENEQRRYTAALEPGVDLDPAHAHAHLRDGVLTVTVTSQRPEVDAPRDVPVT